MVLAHRQELNLNYCIYFITSAVSGFWIESPHLLCIWFDDTFFFYGHLNEAIRCVCAGYCVIKSIQYIHILANFRIPQATLGSDTVQNKILKPRKYQKFQREELPVKCARMNWVSHQKTGWGSTKSVIPTHIVLIHQVFIWSTEDCPMPFKAWYIIPTFNQRTISLQPCFEHCKFFSHTKPSSQSGGTQITQADKMKLSVLCS